MVLAWRPQPLQLTIATSCCSLDFVARVRVAGGALVAATDE